jgi:hypothetical protein
MEHEMKKIIVLILLAIILNTAGCGAYKQPAADNRVSITGSGNLVSRQFDVSGFERIEAGLAFNVAIHQGQEYNLVATLDDNLIDYLHIEVDDLTLKVGLKPGYAYDIPKADMRVEVTMPNLVGIQLNGSSHASLYGFDAVQNFSAELTGSSSLSGQIQVEEINLNAYGGSFVQLSGTGQSLSLDACGANIIDLSNYKVANANIDCACASVVLLNVDARLDGSAAQKAQVYYVGEPAANLLDIHGYASVQPK